MNSRAYRFIFPLNTPADIPSDFRGSVEGRPFETGVFLPQADANWFTREPEYPARLLLLNDRYLSMIPHPTSEQPAAEIDLDELDSARNKQYPATWLDRPDYANDHGTSDLQHSRQQPTRTVPGSCKTEMAG